MDKKLATGIQVALGFLLGIVLNIVVLWVAFLATSLLRSDLDLIRLYSLMFIGAVQLIWLLPVSLFLRWKNHKGLAVGVILAASLVALLNATCWGFFVAGKIKIGG